MRNLRTTNTPQPTLLINKASPSTSALGSSCYSHSDVKNVLTV